MAPRNPRPQDEVLFEGSDKWNKCIDHEFVKQLAKFCKGQTIPLTRHDTNIIGASMEVVNQNCNVNFSQQEAVYWFKRLEKRWKAFGFAINVQGVGYDASRNIIKCNATLWDYIYVCHRIAKAYMTSGEPEWAGLQAIFGTPTPTDVSEYPDIIQISDDSVEVTSTKANATGSFTVGGTAQTSGVKTNESLGSSFWECLGPVTHLSGDCSSSRRNYGRPEKCGPYDPYAFDAPASEDSVEPEGDKDPLGSQASSSAPKSKDA